MSMIWYVRRATSLVVASLVAAGCSPLLLDPPPSPSGSGGGTSTGSTGGGGTGGAVCTAAADCPATGTECASYTCDGGVCALGFAPQGAPTGTQTSGDCQKVICDGQGEITSVDDDSDIPGDGNPCTADLCASGQPSNQPAPAGTSCGSDGLVCNGSGSCLGCLSDADCGVTAACTAHTCDAPTGVCSVTNVPSGQGDPGGQTAGDCGKIVCNGNGGVITVNDDTDPPDDGNPCTIDTCSLGQPHAPVSAGAPCGAGLVCDGAGSCVGCLADAECGTNTACVAYHCQAGVCAVEYTPSGTGDPGGQVAGDCKKLVCNGSGGTMSAAENSDVENDGNACTADTCTGGVAQHQPRMGASCGPGLVCNGASCAAGCVIGGVFHALGAGSLDGCGICSPIVSTSAWTGAADGAACDDGNPCTAGDHCSSGVCGGTAYACPGATSCKASACDGNGGCTGAALPNGTSCPDATSIFLPPGSPPAPGVCNNGTCYYGCYDSGQFWPPSSNFLDVAVCTNCNPSQSTALYSGSCHNNQQFGVCSGGVCHFF